MSACWRLPLHLHSSNSSPLLRPRPQTPTAHPPSPHTIHIFTPQPPQSPLPPPTCPQLPHLSHAPSCTSGSVPKSPIKRVWKPPPPFLFICISTFPPASRYLVEGFYFRGDGSPIEPICCATRAPGHGFREEERGVG